MLQGAGADQRVVVAAYDRLPGRAFPQPGWVREASPCCAGAAAPTAGAGRATRSSSTACRSAGSRRATSLPAPAPLPDGNHTVQVITVDRRGQATASKVRTVRVDTVVPTATVRVTGKRRKGRPLRVVVRAADAGSGVAQHQHRLRRPPAAAARGGRSTTAAGSAPAARP